MKDQLKINDIIKEVSVSTLRSSGPGGQHVNKVETKVVLRWNVEQSSTISLLQKEIIKTANKKKITRDGEIIVSCDSKRSQLRNKEIAFKKLDRILSRSFAKKKKRIATSPSKAAKQKRLEKKRKHSEKKESRRKIL